MNPVQLFQSRNFVLREALMLAQEHGVPEQRVLSALGAERASIWRMGGMLPAEASMEAMEIAADLSGNPEFGLILGQKTDERILASVGVFLGHCTSLAQMCDQASNYMNILYGGIRFGAPPDGRDAMVQFDVMAMPRPLPQYTTAMLVLPVRLFRLMLGPGWAPAAVQISYPALAALERYRDTFGCDVSFSAPANIIEVSQEDWRRPIDIRSTRMQGIINELLDVTQASAVGHGDHLVSKVMDVVRTIAPTGDASARRVAEMLNMSARTMQRSLADRGTNFTDLKHKALGTPPPSSERRDPS